MRDKYGKLTEEIVKRVFTDTTRTIKELSNICGVTPAMIAEIRQRRKYPKFTKGLSRTDNRLNKRKKAKTRPLSEKHFKNDPIPSLSDDMSVKERLAITIDEFFR